jgi:S1-C subfamily serine protease
VTIALTTVATLFWFALAGGLAAPAHAADRPGGSPGRESLELWFFFPLPGPGPRAVIGIDLDTQRAADGARVRDVLPGWPAAEAGIRPGDVVAAVAGQRLAGYADPAAALAEFMRGVSPGQRLDLLVLRDGRSRVIELVAQPGASTGRAEAWPGVPGPVPGADGVPGVPATPSAPAVPRAPGGAAPRPLLGDVAEGNSGVASGATIGEGLELADLPAQLQRPLGSQGGVLVVRAPRSQGWKLEDGDVLVAIDGRRPQDAQHAARILRSYRGGETLQLQVMRRSQALTLEVRLPEPRQVV